MDRSFSLAASLVGAFVNASLAFRLLALWRSLGWEYESEWEATADAWRVDSVKVIWGLLSTYFAAAAFACFIGFVGIAKVRHAISASALLSSCLLFFVIWRGVLGAARTS